jgi:hypothetical protein
MTTENLSARRLRWLMEWEPLDNAGGYNAIDATKDHMLAFLDAYGLLDVLSLYDARTHSQTSFTIPKNPRLPTLISLLFDCRVTD